MRQSSLPDRRPLCSSHVVSEPDVLLEELSKTHSISPECKYMRSLPCSTSYRLVISASAFHISPVVDSLSSYPLCVDRQPPPILHIDPYMIFCDRRGALRLPLRRPFSRPRSLALVASNDPLSNLTPCRASTRLSSSVIVPLSSFSFCLSDRRFLREHTKTNINATTSYPAPMNDVKKISDMRVRRLTRESEGSPCGLWTLADPLDGPPSLPRYAPYGEQSLSATSQPGAEQAAVRSITENEGRKSEGLKPWEKDSKTGKKIKPGRGPKGRSSGSQESSIGSKVVVSSSGSSNNGDNNTGVSIPTTSALPSSQPSPASSVVLDPRLEKRRPRFRLVAPSTPNHVYPAGSAQAAIAAARSLSIHPAFLNSTNRDEQRKSMAASRARSRFRRARRTEKDKRGEVRVCTP